jgi:hypothetical protein
MVRPPLPACANMPVWANIRNRRFSVSHCHIDDGAQIRGTLMTISEGRLLHFALGCFIFSTIVFAVLFVLK